MNAIFNKTVLGTVAACVLVPVVLMSAFGWFLSKNSPVPQAALPAVEKVEIKVDSGERWYNPFSWQNDELVAITTTVSSEVATKIATQQASAAQANSVAYTNQFGWVLMTCVGVGLAAIYGFSSKTNERVIPTFQAQKILADAAKAAKDDRRNSENDGSKDGNGMGTAKERYPAAAGMA